MTTTESTDIELDIDLTDLGEQAIAEQYAGAPENFSDAGPESPVIEPVQSDPAVTTKAADPGSLPGTKVLLVNINFVNEVVFIPGPNGEFTGKTAEFADGYLITDRATADKVLQACPYVYEEARSGQWFTHTASGFRTRNYQAFERFTNAYAANL